MGKQFCRICRTEKNLKFTTKQLREFNKKQLLLAQEIQGPELTNNKASQKLLRTTPTLGNICKDCDARVQIFHRLDDGNESSDSDIEIDVVNSAAKSLPSTELLPTINNCRPDTPVIVDDDDMLYDLFMQKVDQQRQQKPQQPALIILQQHPQLSHETQQQQQFISHFNSQYTPPQSSTGGSEGDDTKIIEVLTSRESTPVSIGANTADTTPVTGPQLPPEILDNQGHRIVAIIDLDDGDEDTSGAHHKNGQLVTAPHHPQIMVDREAHLNNLQNFVVASAKFQTEQIDDQQLQLTPDKSSLVPPTKTLDASHNDDDDEEIVFRRVEPHMVETPQSKKKKRKSYDEKELRLVASLSLVSSDSETEDPPKTANVQKSFICKECDLQFPDDESLSVHERVHEGIKCPECHFGFPQEKRLVYHMRYKHRNSDKHRILTEKQRAPQDSAMTIRLRYMQRLTYYECQLCGRIDEIFKDHKDHIINKHPIESKSLKDPIMKQLKCPVCKAKCGAQYLTLCRHLLEKHEYGHFKAHLRELLHASAFGWNAARHQEATKTARIYQFSKRKSLFFECKICHKVVAGYLNHLKHLKNHSKLELKEKFEFKKIQPPPAPLTSSTPTSSTPTSSAPTSTSSTNSKNKNKSKKEKLDKILESTNKTKQISQKDSKSCKKPLKSAVVVKKSQNLKKCPVVVKVKKPKIKSKELLKPPPEKIQKTTISKPKTSDIIKTSEKSNKRKRKENTTSSKPQLKKVKVKAPPIKQINLQTYTCPICSKHLKGFILYNTHMRQEHSHNEFEQCSKCHKVYFDKIQFKKYHSEQCSKTIEQSRKEKRKRLQDNQSNTDTDVNFNTKRKCTKDYYRRECTAEEKVPEEFKENSIENALTALPKEDDKDDEDDKEKEPLWLKDLLKMYESKNYSNSIDNECRSSATNTAALYHSHQAPTTEYSEVQQCCYCMHLFASLLDLKNHTRHEHNTRKNDILIKFTPLKAKF